MPIYEYVCGSCKKKTEVIQGLNDAPPRVCPHCGGKLKKAFSAPAIQFKGSGFYITDYARSSSSGGEGGGKSSDEKSESKAEKSEKADQSEKAGKSENVEKKAEKAEKKEKKEKKA
jgi:putative FmdB family regulatory protein